MYNPNIFSDNIIQIYKCYDTKFPQVIRIQFWVSGECAVISSLLLLHFIAGSIMTRSGNTCLGPIHGWMRLIWDNVYNYFKNSICSWKNYISIRFKLFKTKNVISVKKYYLHSDFLSRETNHNTMIALVWFLCLMAYQLFRLFNAKAILLEEQ